MNDKKLITLGIIILVVSFVLKLVYFGLKNIKLDEFKPAAVMFVVDASASNQANLSKQKKFLQQICAQLDPEDQIKIIKVSEDAYIIYEGSPQDFNGIEKSMDAFTQYSPEDRGTAYGDGLKKAFNYALTMQKEGFSSSVIVIGDLENEGSSAKQINWDLLPQNISNIQKYIPELAMMFLFAHPKKLDLVKEKLLPVLGEQRLVVSTEENADKSLRKFMSVICR